MFAFVEVKFSFSVLNKETGWEERLQYNLYCIELDIKINQSINSNKAAYFSSPVMDEARMRLGVSA